MAPRALQDRVATHSSCSRLVWVAFASSPVPAFLVRCFPMMQVCHSKLDLHVLFYELVALQVSCYDLEQPASTVPEIPLDGLLGAGVGGRWSESACILVRDLVNCARSGHPTSALARYGPTMVQLPLRSRTAGWFYRLRCAAGKPPPGRGARPRRRSATTYFPRKLLPDLSGLDVWLR